MYDTTTNLDAYSNYNIYYNGYALKKDRLINNINKEKGLRDQSFFLIFKNVLHLTILHSDLYPIITYGSKECLYGFNRG